MASIRKRTLPSGETRWLAAYADAAGKRRFKQFVLKRDADTFLLRVRSEVAAGSHVPERQARTVADAYGLLLSTLAEEKAARATVHNYQVYYRGHVKPFLGNWPLPKLHPADVGEWLSTLRAEGRTEDTCRRARIVLGAVYDEAIRRRLAHSNPVRSLRSRRKTRRAEVREAEAVVRIPEREVVRALLAAAADLDSTFLIARMRDGEAWRTLAVRRVSPENPIRAARAFKADYPGALIERFRPTPWLRPLLACLALAGLRIGEARGLAWSRVKQDRLEVREAVDRYDVREAVKTAASLRDVPIGPQLLAILGNWRAAAGSTDGLVFPSEAGTPLGYSNIANRQLAPLQIALGIVGRDGTPLWTAHSFRHFAVSLWIDEGASLKQVSEWAGHESPEFTQTVYGHLFAKGRTDRRAITAGEISVLGGEAAATPQQHEGDREEKIVALTRG